MAKKLVHWALETLGSPSLASLKLPGNPEDDSTTDSESSEESNSATLQYVNSQLLAHGFTHNPGISLEGTSKEDAEKVLKCLVSMLGQRMEDMSRTEELATKIRTLSYDHERLQSMYRTATETAANAEREMNVHKARLASSTRTLTTTTSSLKSSQAELQRTRTALQSLRATHQAELKKVEKEKDRLLEKVAKLSEHQYVTRVAGIRYANENAVSQYGASSLGPGASSTTPAGQVLGGTGDFLEVTLEESLRHRQELADENRALKALLLRVANDIQLVDFQARAAAADLLVVKKDVGKQLDVEEPEPLTSVALFPLSPPGPTTVSIAISSLLSSLRDSLRTLADPEGRIALGDSLTATSLATARKSTTDNNSNADLHAFSTLTKQMNSKDKEREQDRIQHQAEVRKLNSEIERLRSELEQAQTQTSALAAQIQLKDLSKQVEAMQRPWSIYGSQPSTIAPAIPTAADDVEMDVDPAPPQPAPKPPSKIAASSKQAVSKIFRPEPQSQPEPAAGPSSSSRKHTDDDVFAHLPPPSPALSYLDDPPARSPAKPVAAPVRRSPRKPKPTSPLRVATKAGAKRKASEPSSPEAVKTKKAKTESSKKDAVSESVMGFNAGVVAVSSPKVRPQRKVVEKEARPTAPLPRAKGKEKATAQPSTTAQRSKPAAKPSKVTPAMQTEVRQTQKPPVVPPLSKGSTVPSLPTFVLPPPSPASRLPSMQIPSEAGPSNSRSDSNPFIDSAQPPPPAAPSASGPTSSNPPPQQTTKPPSSSAQAPPPPSVPQTPSRRIFPPGRPVAPHMVHAYSPVKPSPLSRVLMLADSPSSPEEPQIPRLGALMEVDEPEELMRGLDEDEDDAMDAPLSPTPARRTRRLSLAEELGVSDDDGMDEDDEASDVDEVEPLAKGKGRARAVPAKSTTRVRASPSGRTRRAAASDPKGKGKTRAKVASPAKPATAKVKEKENRRRSPRTRVKASPTVKTRSASGSTNARSMAARAKAAGDAKKTRAVAKASTSRTKTAAPDAVPPLELEDLEPAAAPKGGLKLKGKSRGGPRRVPIESADAAPVPVWRG